MKPWARDQIRAALATATPKVSRSRKQAPADSGLVRCTTGGCVFPPTTSTAAMDRHCDEAKHHRYEMVL